MKVSKGRMVMGWQTDWNLTPDGIIRVQSRSGTLLPLFAVTGQAPLWQVEVLQESLALYCNGQRCKSGPLEPGDWLHLGRMDFVFLGPYLLSSMELPGFVSFAPEADPAAAASLPSADPLETAPSAGAVMPPEGSTQVLPAGTMALSMSDPAQPAVLLRRSDLPMERAEGPYRASMSSPGSPDFSTLETVVFHPEAPAIIQPADPPHWFSSMGPACMIAGSSLVSAGVGWMNHPSDWGSVLSGMSSSLSMAAAFVAFGLINRSITKKAAGHPAARNRKLYEAALRDWSGRMDHVLEKAQARYARQSASLQQWDPALAGPAGAQWSLPVGFGQVQAARVELPVIRYDQKEDDLILRLEQLGRKHLQAPCWKCLEPGQTAWIQGWDAAWLDGLFGLWCWMLYGPQRRFVFVGRSWNPPLAHPGICLGDQLLCFDHLAEFLPLARSQPFMEWLVVLELEEPVELPHTSWIVLHPCGVSPWPAGPLPPYDPMRVRASALHGSPKTPPISERLDSQTMDLSRLRQSKANVVVDLDGDGRNLLDFAAMGPHMLAAGTTGSGKSEGMTHILLELTLHNSCRHVQYVLIDFKGGAFGSVFYEFPHMAGSLTNMEAGSIHRLEQALDLELARRQQCIAAMMEQHPYAGADAAAYNAFYPDDPISELFLIVDEYAQLKQECPAFLQKLQESARIGRSLGIHLILATQKPAGVVDGQTFANSRIRLCFMVQSSADSREVLGHEGASQLKRPGEYICEISGQCRMQGQMVYTRAPAGIQEHLRILHHGGLLYERPPALSILEQTSALILQAQESRRWILCPDLPGELQNQTGLIRDAITHLEPYPLQPNEPVWLQGPKDILPQAASIAARSWQGPVYAAGWAVEEADAQVPLEALWQCGDWTEALLLINEEALPDCVCLRLLKRAPCAVLVCSSAPLNRKESLLSLCPVHLGSSLADKEEQYLLFGRGTDPVPAWPLVHGWERHQHFRGAFCCQDPPPVRNSYPAPAWICNPLSWQQALSMPPGLLGFESVYGDPVFWDQKQPLLIAYAQPHLAQPIEQLIRLWHQQDPRITAGTLQEQAPVCLIRLPDHAALLQKPEGLQALYERQICFIGSGLRDHQYTLKLPSAGSGTGNGVLFGKEIVWMHLLEIPCAST